MGLLTPDNKIVEDIPTAKEFTYDTILPAYKEALKNFKNTDHEHRVEIMIKGEDPDREYFIQDPDFYVASFETLVKKAAEELQ